jgi:hypothetical protein
VAQRKLAEKGKQYNTIYTSWLGSVHLISGEANLKE